MGEGTRLVGFDACFNFRDLGGYRSIDGRSLRHGRLFRSDTLHRLSEDDLHLFRELGLRTVIDLRASTEIEQFGRLREDGGVDLVWHHVPMVDGMVLRRVEGEEPPAPLTTAPGEAYLGMMGDATSVVRVFSLLSEGLPAVFHCTSGKDRTGMVAAMTLDLLGVPDEVIGADYELTNAARPRATAWIVEHEPDFGDFLAQIPDDRRTARAETILAFLGGVRSAHGSVEAMLRSKGLSAEAVARLRDELLEPGPPRH